MAHFSHLWKQECTAHVNGRGNGILKRAFKGVRVSFHGYAKIPRVCFLQTRAEKPKSEPEFLCVRTVCGALTGQCSVQCRREQRRPRPGQTQYPGNPRVFRSPGPYLMSLSKKKVALSGVFLSHCLPLALLFPSFSHASPSPPPPHRPLEPLCE